jgi:hypothetical protein
MFNHLLLGVLASALMAVGLLLMKSRGALPEARRGHIAAAAFTWLRDPVWVASVILQTLGYLVYLVALTNTPVSLLAVVMQGGLALFLVMAVIFLGEHASRVEWIGIAALVFAMVAVALSLSPEASSGRLDERSLAMVTVLGLVAACVPNLDARLRASGTAIAIASGVVFGLAALYAKALTCLLVAAPGTPLWMGLAANPFLYLTAAANCGGLVMLQTAFHRVRGIIAMPLSSALSNLVPIAGGMLAFGESRPAEPRLAAMRIAAFAMTIVGGLLMTGSHSSSPSRAGERMETASQ